MRRWINSTVLTTAARQPPTLTTLLHRAPPAPPTLLPTHTHTHTLTHTNTLLLCQLPPRIRSLKHTGPTGTHTYMHIWLFTSCPIPMQSPFNLLHLSSSIKCSICPFLPLSFCFFSSLFLLTQSRSKSLSGMFRFFSPFLSASNRSNSSALFRTFFTPTHPCVEIVTLISVHVKWNIELSNNIIKSELFQAQKYCCFKWQPTSLLKFRSWNLRWYLKNCLFYICARKQESFLLFCCLCKVVSLLHRIYYHVWYSREQYICSKLIISLVSPALILCFFFGVFIY